MNIGDRVIVNKKKGCAGAWASRCTTINGCIDKTGTIVYTDSFSIQIRLDDVVYHGHDTLFYCWYDASDVTPLSTKELI